MPGDLSDLANFVDNLRARLPVASNDAAKAIATAIEIDLLQVTPVDTGEAMSNWQVTLDFPAENVITPHVPSPPGKMVRRNGARVWEHTVDPQITAQNNFQPSLDAAKLVIEQKQHSQPLYISNN